MRSAAAATSPAVHPEVVARDEVAARAPRIGSDRLPVARGHDGQDGADHDGERHRQADRPDPGDDEDAHHLLGRIGRRADVVAAEHRQRLQLRKALVLLPLGADRAPDQERAHRAKPARPSRPIEDGALGRDQLPLVALARRSRRTDGRSSRRCRPAAGPAWSRAPRGAHPSCAVGQPSAGAATSITMSHSSRPGGQDAWASTPALRASARAAGSSRSASSSADHNAARDSPLHDIDGAANRQQGITDVRDRRGDACPMT